MYFLVFAYPLHYFSETMKDNSPDNENDSFCTQSINEILGAITFNITELAHLQDLYDLAEQCGIMNVPQIEMEHIRNKYKEAISDFSKLSHYMISVREILGDEEFQEFFFFHSYAMRCAESEERKRTLFQIISEFRTTCNTRRPKTKIEKRFYLTEFLKWRDDPSHVPLVKSIQDAWEACSKDGPNKSVLSTLTIPPDALRYCQLDDVRLTNLVYQVLWSDVCLPSVKYISQPEKLELQHLRVLRPGGWLNCDVISSYFFILQDKTKYSCIVPRSIDTCHIGFSFDEAKEARIIKRIKRRVGEKKFRNVLVPRNETNYHWSLVEIELSSENENEVVIHHHDSLYLKRIIASDEIKRYKTYAKEFLLKDSNGTLEDIKFKSVVPDSKPPQENGFDCGVFVCIVAASLSGALHVPLPDINQAFITERNCRASICASILTGDMVPPHSGARDNEGTLSL